MGGNTHPLTNVQHIFDELRFPLLLYFEINTLKTVDVYTTRDQFPRVGG